MMSNIRRQVMGNGDEHRRQLTPDQNCALCLTNYNGTYSLDIENPLHQEVISTYLERSRRPNGEAQRSSSSGGPSTSSNNMAISQAPSRLSSSQIASRAYNSSNFRRTGISENVTNAVTSSDINSARRIRPYGRRGVGRPRKLKMDGTSTTCRRCAELATSASTSWNGSRTAPATPGRTIDEHSFTTTPNRWCSPNKSFTTVNHTLSSSGHTATNYSAQWLSLPSPSNSTALRRPLEVAPSMSGTSNPYPREVQAALPSSAAAAPSGMPSKHNVQRPMTARSRPISSQIVPFRYFGNQNSVMQERSMQRSSSAVRPLAQDSTVRRVTRAIDSTPLFRVENSPEVVETPLAKMLINSPTTTKTFSPQTTGTTSVVSMSSWMTSMNGTNSTSLVRQTQLPPFSCLATQPDVQRDRTLPQKYVSSFAKNWQTSKIQQPRTAVVAPRAIHPPAASSAQISNVQVSVMSSGVLDQNANHPGLPLPPFETISSGSHSRGIRDYWADPTEPSNENISVHRIFQWLVDGSADIQKLPANARESTPPDGIPLAPVDSWRPKSPTRRHRRKCSNPLKKLPKIKSSTTHSLNYDHFVLISKDEAFFVRTSHLAEASPILKKATTNCSFWIPHNDGQEYRGFELVGIPSWALRELLNFICGGSYNHNIMGTSMMVRFLQMLGIQYTLKAPFIHHLKKHVDK